MLIEDPLVDALVDKSVAMGHKGRLNYRQKSTLAHLQGTPELQQFEESIKRIPDWVDHARIAHAAQFYQDNLTHVFQGLAVGLVESYTFTADSKVWETDNILSISLTLWASRLC